MQMTRAADYALRAMIHLAALPHGSRVSSTDLAHAAEVPETFLAKVLQRLVTRGLVMSYRGQNGGFELAIQAANISLLEVVEAVDGPIFLNCCVNPTTDCSRNAWCAAYHVWAEAQQKTREVLAAARLDRLAQDSTAARREIASNSRMRVAVNLPPAGP